MQRVAQRTEVFLDQIRMESVMAGGHRRMRCKNNLARNPPHRFIKSQPPLTHRAANGFEHCKRAVSFVQMKDTGSNAKRSERAETTNSEEQFLPDPHTDITAIET